jgi:hypothetical protein
VAAEEATITYPPEVVVTGEEGTAEPRLLLEQMEQLTLVVVAAVDL